MPMDTDRLKLPLPLGNENVTRESINAIFEKIDAGVATQEDLDKAVSEMDIPDASLTQKGKVQLSSKTNGTSETLAATEKAVNDACQAAITAAAADAKTKANAAETNAKTYADTNFRKPSELRMANLVPNSSALLGLDGWKNVGSSSSLEWYWTSSQTTGAFFYLNKGVPSGQVAVLQSATIGVSPNATMHLQAMFHTNGLYANSSVYVDILDVTNNVYVTQLNADPQQWWHRKTMTFKTPANCNAIAVRLVISNVAAGTTPAFARIKVAETSIDTPYTNEADTLALKQSVSNGKASVAAAITGKGIPTAADAPFATMASNINAISTSLTVLTGTISYTGGRIDTPGFKPQVLIVQARSRRSQIYDNWAHWVYSGGPLVAFLDPASGIVTQIGINAFSEGSQVTQSTSASFTGLTFGPDYVSFGINYASSADGSSWPYQILASKA